MGILNSGQDAGASSSKTSDNGISKVHVLFQRHGQAISNIVDFDIPGIEGETVTSAQLHDIARTGRGYLRTGVYLPDGLTQFGLDMSKVFVDSVVGNGIRLDNVYMLVSSPLTRCFQTLQANRPAFQLVGPFNGSDGGNGAVFCHPGLQEATPWPQDFPAAVKKVNGQKTISYVNVVGGNSPGCGRVLGETEVDVTQMIWADNVPNKWETLEARFKAATELPSLSDIEEAVQEGRVWLRDMAKKVLDAHLRDGQLGTPKMVVCIHGGIINFITQDWHCNYVKNSNGDWGWRGSAALKNLEVVVYAFESLTDKDARLVEVEMDEYYARTLGKC